MTSLAAQLKRLAVPHTQSVLASDRSRASLIFDPKEAANLDNQTIYDLGTSGLEELESLDPVFSEYTSSLFKVSSQTWERTLQTREVNAQLDETLSRFLIQLSPYFLLKSAHKALEWLVRRYHIHQMNVDALLQCIFPYHETKMFVRVLQLLPLDNPTEKWHWLKPSAKKGVHLPRSSVVNHCRSDPSFLTFICDLVTTFIKVMGAESSQLRAVVSLWTCTVLGVIQDRGHVTEKVMSILVPAMVRGLKSRCLDYQAASYMVLAQLTSNTPLKEDLVGSLIPALTKRMSPKLCKEVLVCLALVVRAQTVKKLDKKSFKHICRIPGLVPLLSILSEKYDMKRLMELFMECLLPRAVKKASSSSASEASDDEMGHTGPVQYTSILIGLIMEVNLDTKQATDMAKQLLQLLVDLRVNASDMEEEKWRLPAEEILSPLQSRYAVSVDLAIDDMPRALKSKVKREALGDVLSVAMGGAKGLMINGSTRLVLALNHAHSTTRQLALARLSDVLGKEKELPEGVTEEALLLRLADDHLRVVEGVLNMREILVRMVSHDKLTEALLVLIRRLHTNNRMDRTKRIEILEKAVSFLCGEELSDVTQNVVMSLLPYLYINNVGFMACTPTFVMRSPMATRNRLLKDICNEWNYERVMMEKPDENCINNLNIILIEGLASALCRPTAKGMTVDDAGIFGKQALALETTELLKQIQEASQTCPATRKIVMATAGTALETVENFAVATDIALTLLHVVRIELHHNPEGSSRAIVDLQKSLDRGALVWWSLQAIVKNLVRMKSNLQGPWQKMDSGIVLLMLSLLDTLVTKRCELSPKKTIKEAEQWQLLVASLLQDALDLVQIAAFAPLLLTLSLTAEAAPCQVSAVLQVAIFHLVARLWEDATPDEIQTLFNSRVSPVVPWLLVALASEHEPIRRGALACVKAARQTTDNDLGKCSKLMKMVDKQCEEISNDGHHIQNVVARSVKKNEQLMEVLLYWVNCSTIPAVVRERLVALLTEEPTEGLATKLMAVGMDLLRTCADDNDEERAVHLCIIKHLVEALRSEFAPAMTAESAMFTFLITALKTSVATPTGGSVREFALKQVSQKFFHALPSTVEQSQLVAEILDLSQEPGTEELSQYQETLKGVRLELVHIKAELAVKDGSTEATTVKAKRRTRRQSVMKTMMTWSRLSVLLEVLQQRKRFQESEALVSALFALLASLEEEEGEEWEYRQQLILTVLHNVTTRWQQHEVKPKEESVDVEGLVKVVRKPTLSRQTKQSAIGIMASLAHFFPEYLLHHVMSIFTFVGTGLLAADDAHSLAMVTRTITSIIPALLESICKKPDHVRDTLINQIIQVFVDSHHAIPSHRSLSVFTTVVQTLDPDSALWRFLILLVTTGTKQRQQAGAMEERPQEMEADTLDADIEFGVKVCEQFDASTQVSAATNVVHFLQWFTEQHTQGKGNPVRKKDTRPVTTVVDLKKLTGQQMRLLQFHLTRLVIKLLSNDTLVTQVVNSGSESGSAFSEFVRATIVYMLAVVHTHSLKEAPQVKFWKALLSKVYEVIDKVVFLMATPALIEVVISLILHDLPGVRRKAMELLASKLQALQVSPPSEHEHKSLLVVLDKLMPIAVAAGSAIDADAASIQQVALFDIKLLCKLLGGENPQKFIEILKSVLQMLATEDIHKSVALPVVGNALLVVAEVVSTVRAHAIPHLGSIMTPLLKLLMDTDFLAQHELILVCGLTALYRLVTTLPKFLSPYNRSIITLVCRLSIVEQASDQRLHSAQRLAAIRHQMATVLAARVLVPALADTFIELRDSEDVTQVALVSLMHISKEHVTQMESVDLMAHQTPLLNFFCSALDFRTSNKKLTRAEVDAVEEAVIEALLAMVVRLSEAAFRPMFYKLYDWACREDSMEMRTRKLTFFRLADSLAAKLRSLFNLFIGHALQAACHALVANNSLAGDVTYFGSDKDGAELSCLLLGYILDCLTKCMIHDTESVFTGDIFNMLMQPLVDQLENFVGGEEMYEQRMALNIVPCLSHFMLAAKEDSHQKALNYQVLSKTRNVSPKVRFGALKVMAGMAQQLGDDFVYLLPETIPFLAELMEDECEAVERECQQVVSQLEEVLGESLQKYF